MMRRGLTLLFVCLLLACATSAAAEDNPDSRAVPGVSPRGLEQTIYKGIVGNVLDAIPMDPSKRVNLQRTNAIISNTVSGRSLAALAGLSNPVLLIAGLAWGVWAASNIKAEEAGVEVSTNPAESGGGTATEARVVALLDSSAAVNDGPANPAPEPVSAGSIAAGDSGVAAPPRSPVIKIWLPQRANSELR